MGVPTLKERYHDWCSAVIAERVAALPPEEVLRRSDVGSSLHFPPGSMGQDAQDAAFHLLAGMPRTERGVNPRFRRLVMSLLEDAALPTLEEWEEAYTRDPNSYNRVILGFRNERETERAFGT